MRSSRLVVAGLLAGLVLNVGDVVSGMVMLDAMDVTRQRLGVHPDTWNSTAVLATWVIVDFVLGGLIVFTYAAMRPRFGPGPKTAMTAALVLYLAITAVIVGFMQMGIFSPDVVVKAGMFSLANMLLAGLAGGWAYRESA